MKLSEIKSQPALAARIKTILNYHYDAIIRDIKQELPNGESEELEEILEESIAIDLEQLLDRL